MYCAVWFFDTVARRNAYFPSSGPAKASFEDEVTSKLPDSWHRLWEMCSSAGFTDYVVMYSTPNRAPAAKVCCCTSPRLMSSKPCRYSITSGVSPKLLT